MVCFSKHIYQFPVNEKENWFRLIEKFYSGRKVIVKINHATGPTSIFEEVAAESNALDNILSKDDPPVKGDPVTTIEIHTGRIWNELAFLRTLPVLKKDELKMFWKNEELHNDSLETILDLFTRRCGDHVECFYEKKIDIPKEKVFDYAACAAYILGFSSVFYCPSASRAYVLVDDRHICTVEPTNCSDKRGSICFDIDDGYVPGPFGADIPQEFHDNFARWVQNGRNPDETVLRLSL